MISFEDCAALCGLTRTEIAAIAEHEHMPDMAAATLAYYMLRKRGGPEEIRQMLRDDIRHALDSNRVVHAARLMAAFRQFCDSHPVPRHG